MESSLLLIALRRANYAQLRALRARRQQYDRAWADAWVAFLLPVTEDHTGVPAQCDWRVTEA